MKDYIKVWLTLYLCLTIISHPFSVFASSGNIARGTYMSSANVYATVDNEDDVIGNAHIICLSRVEEIDVDMYLQRAYGNVWKNVTEAYNMNVKDVAELDESAIVYNVAPGTYRVYIETMVTGYDGLWDSAEIWTGSFTINT